MLDLEARVFCDGDMVAPSWRGQVDGFGARVESGQEGRSDTQSAGARDRLRDGQAVFDERLRVFAVGQLGRQFAVVGQALEDQYTNWAGRNG